MRSDVPDPFGSIAYHDLLFGAAPTALPCLQIEALSKLFRRFNRADVASRIGIADGVALLIPFGLREHASQLGLPRVGRSPFRLARPTHGFLFHYGHAGSIQLYIQKRNRLSDDHRQIQLHGPLNLFLLAGGDIFTNRLCRSLHGFGGHLQIGE